MALTSQSRKIIGTFALIALIVVYAFVIMLIGLAVLEDAPRWLELGYYLVSGCAWAFPAMLIMRWMLRPDQPARGSR